MPSPLWLMPLIVAAAAVVPIWRGARQLEAEAAGLRASIVELGQVRPLVAQVAAEIAAVNPAGRESATRGIDELGHR
jgi:hypothetical protein